MIERLIGHKNYITGINEQGKILSKDLNLFQIALRNFFGCYPETHYQNATRFIAKSLQDKEIPLSPNDILIIKQFFNTRQNIEEEKGLHTKDCVLYKFHNNSYNFTCNLKSISLCELKVENKYTAIIALKAKNSNSLEVVDCLSSANLKESDPIFPELLNFLKVTLNQSTKIEQIYWKNPPKKFIKSDDNINFSKDEEGKVIIKRSHLSNDAIPSLSLNFLLQFAE